MFVLPSTPVLKWAVLFTSAGSLALGVIFANMLYEGGNAPILLILIAVCLLNAAGLLRSTTWARVTSTILLWFTILYAVAWISPKSVDQYVANGQAPPSVSYLVITTLVVAIPCLVVLHFFRKHRDEFRKAWY